MASSKSLLNNMLKKSYKLPLCRTWFLMLNSQIYITHIRVCLRKMQTSVFLTENPLSVIHFYYMERLTHDNKSFANSVRNQIARNGIFK